MARFDRQIATAKRLIKLNGELCTWHKRAATMSGTEPWKGDATVPQPDPFPVYIVIGQPKNKLANELFHLMSGTDIPQGAPSGLMASVEGFVPEINDTVVRAEGNLVIKSIDIVAPNGTPIIYKLQFA